MGFEGYINSDTGIVHNMSWGVEMLDIPERIGFAVNHAGWILSVVCMTTKQEWKLTCEGKMHIMKHIRFRKGFKKNS